MVQELLVAREIERCKAWRPDAHPGKMVPLPEDPGDKVHTGLQGSQDNTSCIDMDFDIEKLPTLDSLEDDIVTLVTSTLSSLEQSLQREWSRSYPSQDKTEFEVRCTSDNNSISASCTAFGGNELGRHVVENPIVTTIDTESEPSSGSEAEGD